MDGQVVFNSICQMLDAAPEGIGLAYMPKDLALPHVEAGRLSWVPEDWFPTYAGHHLYYPSRNKSPAVSLVVAALKMATAH
ncbi:LysR substrate-binding domain-containing protein (plasmid) [Pseudomonas sp. UBT]|uniref:LysR substrate-binding domain-containing protein n=1 Tax=Pseudomonas sp. UBT TaxID=3239198 RepID=UPI003D807776